MGSEKSLVALGSEVGVLLVNPRSLVDQHAC
jgi:hypothetical protein